MKITKPTFVIDASICKNNIHRMAEKAQNNKVQFRPHFKTHQSAEIAGWFRNEGVGTITVSSLEMAKYFAGYGWKDILVAFPVNILEIESINQLALEIKLSLTVESDYSVLTLLSGLKHSVGLYIKIDTGYHRTGIDYNNFNEIEKILRLIRQTKKLEFIGFLTHSGHTYQSKNVDEIQGIYQDSVDKLNQLKLKFINEFPDLILSIGDTPSCSIIENFDGVDEIRPGNFVFFDVMQYQLGSCDFNDIGVSVVCPVVAKHAGRNEIVIYGGAVHLSKEKLISKIGEDYFGLVSLFKGDKWIKPLTDTFVKSLSQEHGIIKTTEKVFSKIEIGSLLAVIPVHACLAADLARDYKSTGGSVIHKFKC